MNKIFKTLKNHRTGAATAVSELQTGRTKGSRLKAVVVAAVTAATLSSGAQALVSWSSAPVYLRHQTDGGVSHVGEDFAFGNTSVAAKIYNDTVHVLAGDHQLLFDGLGAVGEPNTTLKLTNDDPNILTLFEQSQGFDQVLVHANHFAYLGGVSFSVSTQNADPDYNIFEQFLEQNEERVALARYIIGERAHNLNVIDGRDFSSDHELGMRSDSQNIYTATVLSEVKLLDGKTITLNVPGAQNWGAHLTGEGGVAYVGDTDNKAENVVTIKQLYATNGTDDENLNKDRLHRANNYTGATTVTNVTLNLERKTSLGASGNLTAVNASIVEDNPGALGELTEIDFTDTDLTTKDTSLVVSKCATFKGANVLNVTGSFTVDGAVEIWKEGSLTTGSASFTANSLKLKGAKLTTSSAKVFGDSTVSGESTLEVTNKRFDTEGMLTLRSGSLTAQGTAIYAGDLTIGAATLDSGKVTVAGTTKAESGTSKLTGGAPDGNA